MDATHILHAQRQDLSPLLSLPSVFSLRLRQATSQRQQQAVGAPEDTRKSIYDDVGGIGGIGGIGSILERMVRMVCRLPCRFHTRLRGRGGRGAVDGRD